MMQLAREGLKVQELIWTNQKIEKVLWTTDNTLCVYVYKTEILVLSINAAFHTQNHR